MRSDGGQKIAAQENPERKTCVQEICVGTKVHAQSSSYVT